MKLYYAPQTCAVSCWIALEWAGAAYDVERADTESAEYLKLNPLGTVPTLVTDEDGKPITQLIAILNYISRKYPDADLGPGETLEDMAEYDEILSFLTSDFHTAFSPVFAPENFTVKYDEENLRNAKQAAYARIDRVMHRLEDLIENNHVYANKRSVADAFAFVMVLWTSMVPKTFREYPKIARFVEAMRKDPAVKEIMKASKN